VGIARLFAYTGAKVQDRGLSVGHFYEKLVRIEERMKTGSGREMARQRTERINVFLGWWKEETERVEGMNGDLLEMGL